MKHIKDYICESSEQIDDQWINDNMPVKTADGRQAIIISVNLAEVPNILNGKVRMKEELFDFKWNDKGECIKATDSFGNPKMPEATDNLVKA